MMVYNTRYIIQPIYGEKEVNIPEYISNRHYVNYNIGNLSDSTIETFLNEWKKIKAVKDPSILYGALLFLSFLSSKVIINKIEYCEKQDQIEIRLKGCSEGFLKEKEEMFEVIANIIGDEASLVKYAVGVLCEDLPKHEIPIDKFLKEYERIKDQKSKDEVVKKLALEILKVIHDNGHIEDVAYVKDDDDVHVFLRNCSSREWDRVEMEIWRRLKELEKDYGEKVWEADSFVTAWCLDETV